MVKKRKLTRTEKKALKKARKKGAPKGKRSNTEVDRSDVELPSPFST